MILSIDQEAVYLKRVIINADDFGLSTGINEGICEAFRRGVLSSASLFANMAATEHAVYLIKQNPGMNIGLHIDLSDGSPLLKAKHKLLVNSTGKFVNIFKLAVMTVAKRNILPEIENEIEAQICRLRDYGVSISHIDTHKYVQILPGIPDILIRLAKKYKILQIRNLSEIRLSTMADFLRPHILKRAELRQYLLSIFISALWSFNVKKIKKSGLTSPENFCGVSLMYFNGHKKDYNYFKDCLMLLRPGLTEIMCHPGYLSDDLIPLSPYTKQRESELNELFSEELQKLMGELNIKLVDRGVEKKQS